MYEILNVKTLIFLGIFCKPIIRQFCEIILVFSVMQKKMKPEYSSVW